MRRGFPLLACAVFLAFLPRGFAADEGEGKDGDEGKAAEEKAEGVSSGIGGFGKFLPVGRPNEGVTIPSFQGGVRTSLVRAERMTRIDEDRLEMENMEIEMFRVDGSLESRIKLMRARFHMPTSILSSRLRSRVERPDFEIEGDSLVFDTESQRGRMAGNVEMVIFDVKEFGASQGISAGEEEADEKAKIPERKAKGNE